MHWQRQSHSILPSLKWWVPRDFHPAHSPSAHKIYLDLEACFSRTFDPLISVSAVCLDLIVAHPELSERDAAQEEQSCLRLSAENECEKEQPTWSTNCHSTARN